MSPHINTNVIIGDIEIPSSEEKQCDAIVYIFQKLNDPEMHVDNRSYYENLRIRIKAETVKSAS